MTDGSETRIVRANVKRLVETSSAFASYYANDTQVQTTPWDVRFMFGVITDVEPETVTARVERPVDVRISLPHAKRLLAILSDQLRQYESNIGFIPLPADEEDK